MSTRFKHAIVLCVFSVFFFMVGCAASGKIGSIITNLSQKEAIVQAAGAAASVSSLLTADSSVLDSDAKKKIAEWNAYAQLGLAAAGIVSDAVAAAAQTTVTASK